MFVHTAGGEENRDTTTTTFDKNRRNARAGWRFTSRGFLMAEEYFLI